MPVTSMIKQTLQTSIDWLEFTIFQLSYEDVIERILQLKIEDFADLSKGKFGYNAQTKWGNGNLFVLFNQVDDEPCINHMGVHVILSGTGCRAYESQKSLYTLINVLVALEGQAKLSRIDLAIDDFKDDLIKFSRIRRAALKSEFTSRWNKWDELNSRSTGDGKLLGQTMYFGSQTSDIFCRIYDKALEQKRKAKNKDEEIPEKWTRLEIVYRKERAKMLALHMIECSNVGLVIRRTLQQYIRFVQRPKNSKDSNKSRWKTAIWWERLLENVEPLKLTVKRQEKTVDEMIKWLDKQIGPTLATVVTALDGEINWLYKLISNGNTRLKNKHQQAIFQYQQEREKKQRKHKGDENG